MASLVSSAPAWVSDEAEGWHLPLVVAVFLPLVAMSVACTVGRFARVFSGIFAVVFMLASARRRANARSLAREPPPALSLGVAEARKRRLLAAALGSPRSRLGGREQLGEGGSQGSGEHLRQVGAVGGHDVAAHHGGA